MPRLRSVLLDLSSVAEITVPSRLLSKYVYSWNNIEIINLSPITRYSAIILRSNWSKDYVVLHFTTEQTQVPLVHYLAD